MWRYRILNLCFMIVVIILLATQHSVGVFGPTARTGSDDSSDDGFSRRISLPASVSRAAAFLDDIWQRGMILTEWSMEYNATPRDVFESSSSAETEVLEARFHVANAEVFTGLNENDRAVKELTRAETSLQAAQAIVKAGLAPELSSIRAEIASAEKSAQTEDAFSAIPFEMIKSELDHLITIMRVSHT